MGIEGFWPLVAPAEQTRSLCQMGVEEGFDVNRRKTGTIRIGIDASIWMVQCCSIFTGKSHWQAGKNPELRTLFYKLMPLIGICATPVFIFDGAGRPDEKRGTKVLKKPHWIAASFQAMITACGFDSHIAPGEAEAELAYLNKSGLIDMIFTTDSDVFIFGATHVIRSPNKFDYDHLALYTAEKMRTSLGLTTGGLLLLAVLCKGDYGTGLKNCGPVIAHALARRGLGDSLLLAVQTLPRDGLVEFLNLWRATLKNELSNDPGGVLGRHYSSMAKKVPNSFPSLSLLSLYINPRTSASLNGAGLDTSSWGKKYPDVVAIARICADNFSWGTVQELPQKLCMLLMPHLSIRRLLQPVDHTKFFRDFVLEGAMYDPLPGLSSFMEITKHEAGKYRVVLATSASIGPVVSEIRKSKCSQAVNPTFDTTIRIWIPASVLAHTFPEMVAAFHKKKNSAAILLERLPRLLQDPALASENSQIIDLSEDTDDDSTEIDGQEGGSGIRNEIIDLTADDMAN
ncbi:PIN domain-like protein [Mycena rebaudengoi]|nr:PIN domain-like protein [Mycena rebaudengoi]